MRRWLWLSVPIYETQMTKKYIQTREGAIVVGDIIATHALGEFGICVEILEQTRTPRQNRALHTYFGLLAAALNDAGLEIHMEYLNKSIEVPWTKASVKERLWLPIMQAMTDQTSTTKLKRKEVSEIYETLSRHMTVMHDVFVPFPEQEHQ